MTDLTISYRQIINTHSETFLSLKCLHFLSQKYQFGRFALFITRN